MLFKVGDTIASYAAPEVPTDETPREAINRVQADLRDFRRDIGDGGQWQVARLAALLEKRPSGEHRGMPSGKVGKLALAGNIAKRPDARIGDRAQLVADLDAAAIKVDLAGFQLQPVQHGAAADSDQQMRSGNRFGAVFAFRVDGN